MDIKNENSLNFHVRIKNVKGVIKIIIFCTYVCTVMLKYKIVINMIDFLVNKIKWDEIPMLKIMNSHVGKEICQYIEPHVLCQLSTIVRVQMQ